VFVSHTSELRSFPAGGKSYVGEAERAIAAAGHVIVDMADFPAADQPAAELCAQRVRGCDVYVGVLGTRYGSPVADKPEVSYTELEFDAATAAGLPRLVFLLDTAAADVGIPLGELIDHAFGARQEAFRRRVQASGLVTQSFASPDQLGRLVERSLRELAAARQDAGAPPPGSVLRVCNLPPRNPDFTGRGRSLVALRRGVARGPVAVHGMGGIGKTQLALEFAHVGFTEGRYTIVWWVRAESMLTLAEDLAALAPVVGVPLTADQAEIHAGVRAALARRDGWLLVFDNAPDAAGVRAWLPPGVGHTVITSRDSGWGGLATRVDVQEFTRPESVAYLQRRGRRQEPTEADALADVLGDLPLALAQAAAYLDLHGGLSIAGYMLLYQNEQSAGQLLAAGMDGYPHSVATTWLIHFQELADGHPAALQLLRLCAHLDPDDINLNLLLSRPDLLAGPLTGDLSRAARDVGRREDTIGALGRTGLITRLDGSSRIRLHRLVAQVVRHQLAITTPRRRWWLGRRRGTEAHWANHATATLYGLFPKYPWDPECWPVAADLAAHVSTTVDIATRHSPATSVAGKLLNKLGLYLASRGDAAAGQATLQRAVAILEAVHGPDDFYVARALSDLAATQNVHGDHAAAVASQERALAIFEALTSPNHPLLPAPWAISETSSSTPVTLPLRGPTRSGPRPSSRRCTGPTTTLSESPWAISGTSSDRSVRSTPPRLVCGGP
jgi:hypothetical protein